MQPERPIAARVEERLGVALITNQSVEGCGFYGPKNCGICDTPIDPGWIASSEATLDSLIEGRGSRGSQSKCYGAAE